MRSQINYPTKHLLDIEAYRASIAITPGETRGFQANPSSSQPPERVEQSPANKVCNPGKGFPLPTMDRNNDSIIRIFVFAKYTRQVQPHPGLGVIRCPMAAGCTHGYCCSGPSGLDVLGNLQQPRRASMVISFIPCQEI